MWFLAFLLWNEENKEMTEVSSLLQTPSSKLSWLKRFYKFELDSKAKKLTKSDSMKEFKSILTKYLYRISKKIGNSYKDFGGIQLQLSQ